MGANSWTGKLRLFQYTSDGDVDDNGTADGFALGMESSTLDLNVFIGTEAEFAAWTNWTQTSAPVTEDEPTHTAKVIALWGVKVRTSPEVANNDTGNRYTYGTVISFSEKQTDKYGSIIVTGKQIGRAHV